MRCHVEDRAPISFSVLAGPLDNSGVDSLGSSLRSLVLVAPLRRWSGFERIKGSELILDVNGSEFPGASARASPKSESAGSLSSPSADVTVKLMVLIELDRVGAGLAGGEILADMAFSEFIFPFDRSRAFGQP